MSLTKLQAHIAAGYGYKLVDATNEEFDIHGIEDNELICYHAFSGRTLIPFNKIGTDYFIVARDLSQLTEEIEHEGQRFVPVIRLAEMFYVSPERPVTHYNAPRKDMYGDYSVNCCFSNDDDIYERYILDMSDIGKLPYNIIEMLLEWNFSLEFPPQCVKPLK